MEFVPNRPVATREARVEVDAGLRPGRHRFRLVVVDARGRESAPAELVVTVLPRGRDPRDPLDPRDPFDPFDPFDPNG